MSEQNKLNEEPDREIYVSILLRSLQTGFIGGLLGSAVWGILYYFNLSELAAKHYLLSSWITAGWVDSWLGNLLSILLSGVVSMLAAFIYFSLFRKMYTLWTGAIYSLFLWVVIAYVLSPVFSNIRHVTNWEADTILSLICLFILYGVFIGYSISYDYHVTYLRYKAAQKHSN